MHGTRCRCSSRCPVASASSVSPQLTQGLLVLFAKSPDMDMINNEDSSLRSTKCALYSVNLHKCVVGQGISCCAVMLFLICMHRGRWLSICQNAGKGTPTSILDGQQFSKIFASSTFICLIFLFPEYLNNICISRIFVCRGRRLSDTPRQLSRICRCQKLVPPVPYHPCLC